MIAGFYLVKMTDTIQLGHDMLSTEDDIQILYTKDDIVAIYWRQHNLYVLKMTQLVCTEDNTAYSTEDDTCTQL